MAVKIVTRTYTFGSSGMATVASIIDRPPKTWIGSLALRCHRDNVGDVLWADEDLNPGGYIGPAEAVTMDFGKGQTLLTQFSVYGENGDTVYVTVGLNTNNFDELKVA